MNTALPNRFLPAIDHLRPPKTFADYAAIAICPILIMLVVGSFVFFLVEIGYAGSHQGKLRWALFWFVLAMVLVSRIAIEKGYDHAGVYGLGLAAATGFVLTMYVNNYLGAWCILALIWWATNKLTWDSTVIDDDLDASGEGLLQAARLDVTQEGPLNAAAEALHDSTSRDVAAPNRKTSQKPSWWKLVYQKKNRVSSQPHAPGLWVIYFSLVALPVFGFGQGLIPSNDVAARARGFAFILFYLLAALGLLLITSFLGLRRYLRQRHLPMPSAISATWVSLGSTLILAIVICCILLPRPNASWSVDSIIDRFGDPGSKTKQTQKARAAVDEASPQNPTQQAHETGNQGGNPSQRDSLRPGEQSSSNSTRAALAQTDQNNPGEPGSQNGQKGAPGGTRPGESQQSSSTGQAPAPQSPAFPLTWIKPLIYLAAFLFAIFIIAKNRQLLLQLLQNLLAALQASWLRRAARKNKPGSQPLSVPRRTIPPPFTSFTNPFDSGRADQMPVQDLVVYTFNALEAWAAGFESGRNPEQTPLEFANLLGDRIPDLALDVRRLARLYVQVAYGAVAALPPCRDVLEILWTKMTVDNKESVISQ
jgi:hypothetical protein